MGEENKENKENKEKKKLSSEPPLQTIEFVGAEPRNEEK
jgi:hypothetical protein